MGRIILTVSYFGQVAVLTEEDGSEYLRIEPNEIFSVGNSIGGYWARPIKWAGSPALSLVRIGGREKQLTPDELRYYKGRIKGTVLKPGMTGLWATSSGSARNGIFHRYTRPEDEQDPILRVLREMGLGTSILQRMEEGQVVEDTEVFYDHSHCLSQRLSWHWETDGEKVSGEYRETCEPHGFFGGGGESYFTITNATWAISYSYGRSMAGSLGTNLQKICVWPGCKPEDLGNALAPFIWGDGANYGYKKAMENLEDARSWFSKNSRFTPSPLIKDGVLEFSWAGMPRKISVWIDGGKFSGSAPIERLFEKFGALKVVEGLWEETSSSLMDEEGQYLAINARYETRKVPVQGWDLGGTYRALRDKGLEIQFRPWGVNGQWIGCPEHGGMWNWPEDVELVFSLHPNLRKRLYEAAPE